MNYFLNLKDGKLTITTYRQACGLETDQADLLDAYQKETGEELTAWIDDEDHPIVKDLLTKDDDLEHDCYEDYYE